MNPPPIRPIQPQDPPIIAAAFAAQGWRKPAAQYERYLQEQTAGHRHVLVAERDGRFAGYLTIVWASPYPPFHAAGIPEIMDFNVLQAFQRQGIGTALMDAAEAAIARRSPVAGIGVGVLSDYGPAHILYTRRGYIPDGRGLYKHGRWPRHGDSLTLDDDVALYFTKKLTTINS